MQPRLPTLRLPPLDAARGPQGTWFICLCHDGMVAGIFCPRCGMPNSLGDCRIRNDGLVLENLTCHAKDCRAAIRIALVDYDLATPTTVLFRVS